MCGIAGIWSKSAVSENALSLMEEMTQRQVHRGPDTGGTIQIKNVCLGHRRLSIIDLDSRSNQPIKDLSGNYFLVFNGEIYNYIELKTELHSKYNINFSTTSDTELLLYGLKHEGEAFIQKLNGFFAFAFYDAVKNEVLLARDRYGIKPLYYSDQGNHFLFASELKSVLRGIENVHIDKQSLFNYLQLSYIPAPNTIVSEVEKLEPGHLVKISSGAKSKRKYYEINLPNEYENHIGIGAFREKLTDSVKLRLRADVPVGTFLSGGLDSSVISLLASQSSENISSFSVGFPDHPFYDESPDATWVAKQLSLDHHVLQLTESDIDSQVSAILDSFDEPFADSSAILVNLISKFAREHVKVVLSGDGADEIMGGYNKHRAMLHSLDKSFVNFFLKSGSHALALFPESRSKAGLNQIRKLRRYAKGLKLPLAERYEQWASFTEKSQVAKILKSESPGHNLNISIDPEDFNSILKADMKLVLANDMLHKVDLMSMRHSLEVRVPFLDHMLVDYLFTIPASEKVDKKSGKNIMRKAFEKDFPPQFFNKKKKGFEAPLTHWLAGPLKSLREDLLDKELLRKQDLFNPEEIKRLERKSLSGNPGDSPHTIWALLVFQHWYLQNIPFNR
jgi:asparagine synthase (glutamine-hydrolysing)